jgi:C1A family cysteine protease
LDSESLYSATSPSKFYVNWNGVNGSYVTPVKNQGSCGSCWAYAGLAEVESYFLKRQKLYLDFSEQQLVNCVPLMQRGNLGCGGGYLNSVAYYMTNYPVTT